MLIHVGLCSTAASHSQRRRLQLPRLGALASALIAINGAGAHPSWHLASLDVTEEEGGQTWHFEGVWRWGLCSASKPGRGFLSAGLCSRLRLQCLVAPCEGFQAAGSTCHTTRCRPPLWIQPTPAAKRWLGGEQGLAATLAPGPPAARAARYSLRLRTGDARGAGTDAGIELQLVGAGGGVTNWMKLPAREGQLERGREDCFEVEGADVGPLARLRVRSDGAGGCCCYG